MIWHDVIWKQPLGPAEDQLGVGERTALLHEEERFPGETSLIDLAWCVLFWPMEMVVERNTRGNRGLRNWASDDFCESSNCRLSILHVDSNERKWCLGRWPVKTMIHPQEGQHNQQTWWYLMIYCSSKIWEDNPQRHVHCPFLLSSPNPLGHNVDTASKHGDIQN